MDQKKRSNQHNRHGATIIELLFVMLIVGVFLRLVTLNLFRSQQRASLSVTREGVIRDLRGQQMKAMSGTTRTPGSYVDYSVRFEQQRYILYPGTVYVSNNPENTVVTLDPIVQFSDIRFPGATVSFARLSGDMRSYSAASSSAVLQNTQTGEQYTITINERGVPFAL